MSFTYKFAILGGTFDHFHVGHVKFITTAFNQAENITIGIVERLGLTDKIFTDSIEDYSTREKHLKSFLDTKQLLGRAKIIPINDIYGTSLTNTSIEAIFVTESTRTSAEKINIERHARSMAPLSIIVVPYAIGDDEVVISSGRIREGVINRQGRSYLKFFLQKETYRLPDNLRMALQQPIGRVVKEISEIKRLIPRSSYIISIGDIVSLNLIKAKYPTAFSIIDYKTRRLEIDKKVIDEHFPVVHSKLTNPAGTINPIIADLLKLSLSNYIETKETQIIGVDGEEDLLALPAILLSPLSSFVIYGQYNVGMIVVEITEEIKSLVKLYLEQF